MTNSADLSGGKPTPNIGLPSLMSFGVITRSHVTKEASSGARPANASCQNAIYMITTALPFTFRRSGPWLGSNTAPQVPWQMPSST
jgi:hypothetical protein